MDTRLPYFDGQKDYHAYVRFLDNRKEYDAYDKKLSEHIAKFLKAAALYGKAKEIEGLHAKAETLALRAQGAFEEREIKLVAGEKALVKELLEHRAKMKNREVDVEQVLLKGTREQKARQAAVKAREDELAKLEVIVAKAEQAVQKKTEAAVEAKRAADDMVKRMKAAAVQTED